MVQAFRQWITDLRVVAQYHPASARELFFAVVCVVDRSSIFEHAHMVTATDGEYAGPQCDGSNSTPTTVLSQSEYFR
jgi:hypothetical protein